MYCVNYNLFNLKYRKLLVNDNANFHHNHKLNLLTMIPQPVDSA
jgi:hypothetical protein